MLTIRDAQPQDLSQLLELYTYLHENEIPELNDSLHTLWQTILSDPNHFVFVGMINEQIVASCVMLVVPNLTHNQQPYALIENVITHPDFRGKGYATQILNQAKYIAIQKNCYKMMLLTGSKKDSTLQFYQNCGYNCVDKTGFIQWL